jgi:excisionase family DNA binding protein
MNQHQPADIEAGHTAQRDLAHRLDGKILQIQANLGENNGWDELLTPAEVAVMFKVDPKTVTRWAKAGRLTSVRTLGGHRRYRATEVRALLRGLR